MSQYYDPCKSACPSDCPNLIRVPPFTPGGGTTTPSQSATGIMLPFSTGSDLLTVGIATIAFPLLNNALMVANGAAGLNTFAGVAPNRTITSPSSLLGLVPLLDYSSQYSSPTSGTITSMAFTFNAALAVALTLGSVFTFEARVFINRIGTTPNVFVETTAAVTASIPVSILQLSLIAQGVSGGLNVPVNQGDRLLLVVSVSAPSVLVGLTAPISVSGGLTIV